MGKSKERKEEKRKERKRERKYIILGEKKKGIRKGRPPWPE